MKRKKPRSVSPDRQPVPVEDKETNSGQDSASMNLKGLNRRRFLIAGTGAAAGAGLALTAREMITHAQERTPGSGRGGGGGQGGGAKPRVASALTLSTSATSPPFAEPKVVTPRIINGKSVLNLELDCEMTDWLYQCEGQTAHAQIPIYNQDVPGPTMLIEPGTTLNLVLNNKLNENQNPYDDPCKMGGMSGMSKQVVTKTGAAETRPECFMHTNLHTHGLWVSPCSMNQDGTTHCGPYAVDGKNAPLKVSSDDVLLDIFPQQSNNYCIVLPDFHDPGTYWYHSHVHGSSAYQVSSGMAGAIIIREPVGQELVPPDRDKIFLMQEVIFNPPPLQPIQPPSPQPTPKPTPNIPLVYQEHSTTEGSAGFLINGQCKPTLQIRTGQNYRWRFINGTGTPRGMVKLRLIKMSDNPLAVINDADIFDIGQDPTGFDPTNPKNPGNIIAPVKTSLESKNAYMNLIAVDGLVFYGFSPQPVKKHLIAPGNRADFIVNIPGAVAQNSGPGKYALVKDAFPKDTVSFNMQPTLDCSTANQLAVQRTVAASLRTTQVLAYIEVHAGTDTEPLPSLPKTRPFNLQPIATVDRNRTGANAINFLGLGGGVGGGNPAGNFLINCKAYDPNDPGIVAQLNTAEEWELKNFGNTDFPHPFHIHVNPFQIVGRTVDFETDNPRLDPKNPCNWIWQDTVAIPATIPPLQCNNLCPGNDCPPTPSPTPTPTATSQPTPTPNPCTPPPNAGHVNIRTRFLVYPGEYVIHCHILIHEDVGMMSNVTIQDPANTGIGPCKNVAAPTQASVACVNRTKPRSSC